MLIHAPKPRPVEAGLWVFCDQTEELHYLNTDAESAATTTWPLDLDRFDRRVLAVAADALLNAAGAGRAGLDQALRSRYVGDRRGDMEDRPDQAAYWHRIAWAGSLGAAVRRRLDEMPIVVDTADDNTSLTRNGNAGSSGSNPAHPYGRPHGHPGPGGGGGGGGGPGGSGGTGGGGSRGGRGGSRASNDYPAILRDRTWTALRCGGSGGRGNPSGGGRGGSGGNGRVRIAIGDLTLSGSYRGGSGSKGSRVDNVLNRPEEYFVGGGGGGGGGGLIIGLATGTVSGSVSVSGGSGGSGASRSGNRGGGGGHGGSGRLVVFYGNANTATVAGGVLTTYQMLPALPSGGLLVM